MTLLQTRHILSSLGIGKIIALSVLISPIVSAVIAMRRGRSILAWTTVSFFMPFLAPFAMIPFCSLWSGVCGGYGVFTDLARLLAAFICPLLLWMRPPIQAPPLRAAADRWRDLAISLLFLGFLFVAVMMLSIMYFPAQH